MNSAGACSGLMQNALPHWRILNPEEAASASLSVPDEQKFRKNALKTHNSCG